MEDILKEYSDIIDEIDGEYSLYLRKSRADIEAEMRGEDETLARHLKILLELARSKKIKIGKIYHEVVSGESIADRSQMQELLEDVKQGRWKGVLVVEVERLARGNTKDQGIVAEAFSISSTKIVTPIKTYDPDNEFDQEYFEFGLFMSRREYKVINRRLQRGRVTSVMEGKFVGNIAPFGWTRVKLKNDKGFTVEPNEESKTSIIMFDLMAYEDYSTRGLARKLNSMGLKPRKGEEWTAEGVKAVLTNPINIGKVRWETRKVVKVYKNGKIIKTRPRNKNYILVDGLQPRLIKQETWDIVQEKLSKNQAPIRYEEGLKNPLSGIVFCAKCGKPMQRRPYRSKGWEDTLICNNTKCNNISSKLYIVENKIIKSLKKWLENYEIDFQENIKEIENQRITMTEETILNLKRELEVWNKKMTNIYDFLEDGTYSKEMFNERKNSISQQINNAKIKIEEQTKILEEEKKKEEEKKNLIPQVKNIIDLYDNLKTAEEKNLLLRTVTERIEYLKTEKCVKKDSDFENFELDIFPKINNALTINNMAQKSL